MFFIIINFKAKNKMKIKLNQELKGVDGIETLKGDKGRALTFKDICVNAILTPEQGEDEKKKYERYELFKKIREGGAEVDLKVEEVVLIKKSIGKVNPPLVMGQCWEILEQEK
jgi:hypothetical protein